MRSLRVDSAGRLLLLVLCSTTQFFGQSAPSAYLLYPDSGTGDIIMTRVSVPITTAYTYYETMGWYLGPNGYGYGGIQDGGSSGRNYIVSLWDPGTGMSGTSTVVYANPAGVASRFCCEGTGVHFLNYSSPWQVDQWYRIVVRAWDYDQQTYVGFWSYDETAQTWTHQATLAFPASGSRPTYNTNSFIEDFGGTGQNVRRMALNDGWKRLLSGAWTPWSSAVFQICSPGPGCTAFDAGVLNSAYYMQIGGSTTPTLSPNAVLALPGTVTSPSLTVGRLLSAGASYDPANNNLTVSWSPDPTASPQFSYRIEVFDNATLTGSAILSQTDLAPDVTLVSLTPPSPLGSGS